MTRVTGESVTSFPRTQGGCPAGPGPACRCHLIEAGEKNCPSFPLAAKGACCHRRVCLGCGWLSREETGPSQLFRTTVFPAVRRGFRAERRPPGVGGGSGAVAPPPAGPTLARETPATHFKMGRLGGGDKTSPVCFCLRCGRGRLGDCSTWAASEKCPQQPPDRLPEDHHGL